MVSTVKKLCTCYKPIFTKISKYSFNTSNGTGTITVPPTENAVFLPSRDWQYSNSHKLEPHSKSQYTDFTTEARVVQTHSVFFTVVCVCRRKCVVGKLPCNAVAFEWALAQTDCHALATTHLCRLFFHVNVWLDGPWRRHSFKRRQHHEDAMAARRKRPKKRVFWTLPCGTIWQSFFCAQGCPKAGKKKIAKLKSKRIFIWSHNSVGL